MSRPTWLNRCTRWTTLVALMLATLAPGIAHALRHERGQALPWQKICTATGAMRVIAVDDNGAPAQAHAFEQCLTCLLHHGASAPPPVWPALALVEPALATEAPLLPHTPRAPHVWPAAQPRAPPLLA